MEGRFQVDVGLFHPLEQRGVLRLFFFAGFQLNVGTEATLFQKDLAARLGALTQWLLRTLSEFQQFDRFFEREFIGAEFTGHARFAVVFRFAISLVNEWAVAADSKINRIRVVAVDRSSYVELANFSGVDILDVVGDSFFEPRFFIAKVEISEVDQVLCLAATHGVEEVFHLGGELVVDQRSQVLFKQP